MAKKPGIFKQTIKAMVLFALWTFLSYLAFILFLIWTSTGINIPEMLDEEGAVNPQTIDWETIDKLEGHGFLIDQEGRIMDSFNSEETGQISLKEVLDLTRFNTGDQTCLTFETLTGDHLLVIFPKKVVNLVANIDVNAVVGEDSLLVPFMGLLILSLYLLGIYWIVRSLSKSLSKEQARMAEEGNKSKDAFFRGLAHDIKTPLTAVLGYTRALKDGMVDPKDLDAYQDKVYANALLVKNRLDDMVSLTSLSEGGIYKPVQADLLEHIRRYVGDHYSWFAEQGACLDLIFEDKVAYQTTFDPALFDRVLQNILQNSVDHNQGPVNIRIDFDGDTLTIQDDGRGISQDLWTKIFDPMVTGDASRTGDKNRGLGLANVQRIVTLHGWKVWYDQKGFSIEVNDKKDKKR